MKFVSLMVGVLALAQTQTSKADLVDYMGVETATEMGVEKQVGAIVRVIGSVGESRIWAKDYFVKFDIRIGTSDGDEIDYADIKFYAVENMYDHGDEWFALRWLPVKYKKDLALDIDTHLSIGIIEFAGGMEFDMGGDLKLVMDGALDILSYGYSKRFSDGKKEEGWHTGLDASIAIEGKKFRVALGGALSHIYGDREFAGSTAQCGWLEDDYGNEEYACWKNNHYNYDTHTWGEVYLEGRYKLSDSWQIYAKGGYVAFGVDNDANEDDADSDEDVFRVMFGVMYSPSGETTKRYGRTKWAGLR